MPQDFNNIALLTLAFLVAVLLLAAILRKSQKDNMSEKLDELYLKIRNDINSAVTPNFISLSPSTDELVQYAIEVWRIEQRVRKLQDALPENQRKGLENSVQKLKRYFEKNDLAVIDYTNQKFNDGLIVDILSVEKDPAVAVPIVKETVEPAVTYRGQVVHKAKIIVITKQD